jgi:hypothetical protein
MGKEFNDLPSLHEMASALYEFYGTYQNVSTATGVGEIAFARFFNDPDRQLIYNTAVPIIKGYIAMQEIKEKCKKKH